MRRLALAVAVVLVGVLSLRAAGTLPYVSRQREFAIAVYEGPSPFALTPTGPGPALTADSVTDIRARYVADPFLLRDGDSWQVFFEAVDGWAGRGVIATARSRDLQRWDYGGVVLREPFHLSYPYVFRSGGAVYMTPEAQGSGAVRLYRATSFPTGWTRVADLLPLGYADPSVLEYGGRFWLFAAGGDDTLWLFTAPRLTGPWTPHPRSPVVRGDPHHARPGGRVQEIDGRLYRFAQDDAPTYGLAVSAFEITTLTEDAYAERPVSPGPLLQGSGAGWNARGMHHLDAWPKGDGRWVAVVDGWRRTTAFGFREWR